jgi:hypothetical protein
LQRGGGQPSGEVKIADKSYGIPYL